MALNAYSCTVAKKVVAQILAQMDVESAETTALESLADVLLRYITEIGKASNVYATASGRTETNLGDALLALDDVGSTVDDVQRYAERCIEEPFATPLPSFPVKKKHKTALTFRTAQEEPPSRVPAPDYYPLVPPRHTYQSTATYDPSRKTQRTVVLEQASAKQDGERAWLKLCETTRDAAAADGAKAGGGVGVISDAGGAAAQKRVREREQSKAVEGMDNAQLKGNVLLSADGAVFRDNVDYHLKIEAILDMAERRKRGVTTSVTTADKDAAPAAPAATLLPADKTPVTFTPLWDSRLGKTPRTLHSDAALMTQSHAPGAGSVRAFGEDQRDMQEAAQVLYHNNTEHRDPVGGKVFPPPRPKCKPEDAPRLN